MPKFAMHNDPKVRHAKYAQKVSRTGHHEGGMAVERERESMSNAIAGNSTWPAMSQEGTGPTERGKEEEAGISIFDPVLCELAYRWFCPVGGTILDPFAGGSVRGIVASKLGRQYVGVELRQEQVDANRLQGAGICENPRPTWYFGDSVDISKICHDVYADFIFSCPPYADLEVYSDDPKDISNMPYPQFLSCYKHIIKGASERLKNDRFACFVIGEARGKDGNYYGLVPDTIRAFEAAGLKFYNEAILVTAVGSLPIRAGRPFVATRKLGKTHQNVLIFVKGDGKKATQACGEIDISDCLAAVGAGQ